jgi:hypothetical protein
MKRLILISPKVLLASLVTANAQNFGHPYIPLFEPVFAQQQQVKSQIERQSEIERRRMQQQHNRSTRRSKPAPTPEARKTKHQKDAG